MDKKDDLFLNNIEENIGYEDKEQKINIRELSMKELQEYVMEIGYQKYVGAQIFDWLHNKYEMNFDNNCDN